MEISIKLSLFILHFSMARFISKILLFFALCLSVIFGATKLKSLKVEKQHFENYDSESNLFTLGKNQHYLTLFMGISHARMFTRSKNQIRVEQVLEGPTMNIGRGLGLCGPIEENLYLKYFYSKGNTTDYIVYIPTPPMLFSEYLSTSSATYEHEPFKLDFFMQCLFSNSMNKNQKLYRYLRYKFKPNWKKIKPGSAESDNAVLPKFDSASLKWGLSQAYPKGLDSIMFERSKLEIIKTIRMAQKNNTKVIFMFTPTLFGGWPGHEEILKLLIDLKKEYPVQVYDFSDACVDINLYRDHHHFNSKGVDWFTKNYLYPIIYPDKNSSTELDKYRK